MEARRPLRAATGAAVLAAAFFHPFLSPASAETAPSAASASSADAMTPAGARARLLDLVNRDRAAAGRAVLQLRNDLDVIATDHSLRMAAADDIFHNDDLFTSATKAAIGAATVGENVAVNTSIDDAHRRLMDSPGHRANILSPDFSLMGIGVVIANGTWFVTEVFIQPKSSAAPPASAAPATTTSPAAAAPAPAAASGPATPRAATPATNARSAPAVTAPPATAPRVPEAPVTPPPAETPPGATTGAADAGQTTSTAGAPTRRPESGGSAGGLSGGAAALMLVAGTGAAAANRRRSR